MRESDVIVTIMPLHNHDQGVKALYVRTDSPNTVFTVKISGRLTC